MQEYHQQITPEALNAKVQDIYLTPGPVYPTIKPHPLSGSYRCELSMNRSS